MRNEDVVGLCAIAGFVVAAVVASVAYNIGHNEGMRRLCDEQLSGVIVEGKCIARDSLKEVKP